MDLTLKKLANYDGVQGPLLLVILDGVGLYKGADEGYPGNAVDKAQPATLCGLMEDERIMTRLKAHGTAVGMPTDDDMGNSEVGHNAMGAGRVFAQGAQLVDEAIASGRLFEGETWRAIIANAKHKQTPVHFIGLLSDGNVHSNISQLCALLNACDNAGVEEVYVHGLLDGRDVPPISALRYFGRLEDYLGSIRREAAKSGDTRRYYVASGGGRMVTTMDRYEADWSIVDRGYHCHVMGDGPLFPNCLTAIRTLREQTGQEDQYLPHWVVSNPEEPEQPLAQIEDGHAVVVFNFRGDRAIEISRAFVADDFNGFERRRRPDVIYAGMMEYDGDTHMPPQYLVEPPAIDRTVSQYLAANGVAQFAISETQKFGHVTYFWNGNNSAKFNAETEEWQEIPSDRVPFDQAPAMKAPEIAAAVIAALRSGAYKFLRVNFANGDMVGHTGSLAAAIEAVKAVDAALKQIKAVIDELEGTLIVTADHGNCEQMFAVDKKTGKLKEASGGGYELMTSHTLNPVPFIIHGPDTQRYELNAAVAEPGLGNIAATILALLGYQKPAEYLDALITVS
jgi:2,3-bisphosphoglycerate-independent phosphoglycerate mutase